MTQDIGHRFCKRKEIPTCVASKSDISVHGVTLCAVADYYNTDRLAKVGCYLS